MADIKKKQSIIGDYGLKMKAGQDPFLAGLAGALGGGLSGFTAAGGDVGGALEGLGVGIGKLNTKGNLARSWGTSGMGTTPWNPSEGF